MARDPRTRSRAAEAQIAQEVDHGDRNPGGSFFLSAEGFLATAGVALRFFFARGPVPPWVSPDTGHHSPFEGVQHSPSPLGLVRSRRLVAAAMGRPR
jgi:hypothetical protein